LSIIRGFGESSHGLAAGFEGRLRAVAPPVREEVARLYLAEPRGHFLQVVLGLLQFGEAKLARRRLLRDPCQQAVAPRDELVVFARAVGTEPLHHVLRRHPVDLSTDEQYGRSALTPHRVGKLPKHDRMVLARRQHPCPGQEAGRAR